MSSNFAVPKVRESEQIRQSASSDGEEQSFSGSLKLKTTLRRNNATTVGSQTRHKCITLGFYNGWPDAGQCGEHVVSSTG